MGEYRQEVPAAALTEQPGHRSPLCFPSLPLAKAFTITFMSFPKGIKRLRHE